MFCWSIQLFCQTKKGVKRKADTTTSCSVTPASTSVYSSSLEFAATPLSAPAVIGRQDVLRPVKRLKKELAESDSQPRVGASVSPVADAWKLCANIVRDLMSKKCLVSLTFLQSYSCLHLFVLFCYIFSISIHFSAIFYRHLRSAHSLSASTTL